MITKRDIAERIYLRTGGKLTLKDSRKVAREVFAMLADALAKGESAQFRGFGRFEVHDYAPHRVRDPKNGGTMVMPARRRVFFRAGKELNESVNKNQ